MNRNKLVIIAASSALTFSILYLLCIDLHASNAWIAVTLVALILFLSYANLQFILKCFAGFKNKPYLLPEVSDRKVSGASVLIYTVKASSKNEVDKAFGNLKRSFADNLKSFPGLIGIYLSSSELPETIEYEIGQIKEIHKALPQPAILYFHRNPIHRSWGEKWGAYQDLFAYLRYGLEYPSHYLSSKYICGGSDFRRKPEARFFKIADDFSRKNWLTQAEADQGIIGDTRLLWDQNAPKLEIALISDADVRWPAGSISKTVSKIACPDNKEYEIFQPRISISNATRNRYTAEKKRSHDFGLFKTICEWNVSRHACFYGKGAIKLENYFQKVIATEALPPYTKSHDFQESLYLKCAFLPDVHIYEEIPVTFISDLKKQVRWLVGDIQGLIRYQFSWNLMGKILFRYRKLISGNSMVPFQRQIQIVHQSICVKVVFVAWLFLSAISYLNFPDWKITYQYSGFLWILFLFVIFQIIIFPKIIFLLIRKKRLRKARLFRRFKDALNIGFRDAWISLLYLQGVIYDGIHLVRGLLWVLRGKKIEWETMAKTEAKSHQAGFWQYLVKLWPSLGIGVFFYMHAYQWIYPSKIYLDMGILLSVLFICGPGLAYLASFPKAVVPVDGIFILYLAAAMVFFMVPWPVEIPLAWKTGNNLVALIDDFNSPGKLNMWGGRMECNATQGASAHLRFKQKSELLHADYYLHIDYELPKAASAMFWIGLKPADNIANKKKQLNLREYRYLSFWLKTNQTIKLEMHEDTNGDGRYDSRDDRTSYVWISANRNEWTKVIVPLQQFVRIKKWDQVLELVFVVNNFQNQKKQGCFAVDDLLLGTSVLTFDANKSKYKNIEVQRVRNHYLISIAKAAETFACNEGVVFQVSSDRRKWSDIGHDYHPAKETYQINWSPHILEPNQKYYIRALEQSITGPRRLVGETKDTIEVAHITDDEFLEMIERKMFDYFIENQNMNTGLFSDASWGGNASTAVTGFGLAALCIAAERNWLNKAEASRRAALVLKTFSRDGQANRAKAKYGLFYHFLDMDTAENRGDDLFSTIDSAILLCGIITAGEYFGGAIKDQARQIQKSMQWEKFIEKNKNRITYNHFSMGMNDKNELSTNFWDYYTDEISLICLLAIASPNCPAPESVFYSWRREKGRFQGIEHIQSWHGSLFTYQYAQAWFDFRNKIDKQGVNWWNNSRNATLTNREFCNYYSSQYAAYGKDLWGITGMYVKDRYAMDYGAAPSGSKNPIHDGTISPSGPAGSIPFTPAYSLDVLKNIFLHYPEAWGRYGFKDAFNLNQDWYSENYSGLGMGITLLMLENFRSGLIWKTMSKNEYIAQALKKALHE